MSHAAAPVRSFDIFDTLIARKCVHPATLHELVGQRLGMGGFVKARIRAEQRLAGREYTLEDIYSQLRNDGLAAEVAQRALMLELDAERENVIPIVDNLRKVRDGDLLLTDMYLPTAFIVELLWRAGLRRHVSIVRTSGGKAHGHVWQALHQGGISVRHVGDNPHSDVQMPARFGFPAELSAVAAPDGRESLLLAHGLTGTALLARAVRLGLDRSGDETGNELAHLQAGVNVPLLTLATLHLRRAVESWPEAPDRLLFSSRDCRHWQRFYGALGTRMGDRPGPGSAYFFTSRLARIQGSTDYLKYFRSLATPRSVVVDLCGTGLSLERLFVRAGVAPQAWLLYRMIDPGPIAHYSGLIGGARPPERLGSLLDTRYAASPSAAEILNYARHGMVMDVTQVAGTFVPRMAESELSAEQEARVERMEAVIDAAVALIDDPLIRLQLDSIDAVVDAEKMAAAAAALWAQADASAALNQSFAMTHAAADAAVYPVLGAGA